VTSQVGGSRAEANFELVVQSNIGPSALFRDIFGVSENPDDDAPPQRPAPLRMLVDDCMSTCVLLLGSKTSQRSAWYAGSTGEDGGMIVWAGERIFELLQRKGMMGGAHFEYTVTVSMVEIYDEIANDLLQPANENLQLEFTPDRGCSLRGVHERACKDNNDIRECVKEARGNRDNRKFDTGNAADSCSAVFELVVTQRSNEDPDVSASSPQMKSRLLLVDAPSTHKWVENEEELRVREGTTLNRSLLSLRRVCTSLSRQDSVQSAPFQQSKLTALLEDVLGGNAFVVGLSFLVQGESESNAALLRVASRLNRVFHFPVSGYTFVNGLEKNYRRRLRQQMDKKKEADEGGDTAKADYQSLLLRAQELEKELIDTRIEANTAKDDGVKVFKMLELFKQKYNQLVQDKTEQSEKLIAAEEEKLHLTSILLAEKLAKGRIEQQSEEEKFRLEAELLRAKTEVSDLETKLAERNKIAQTQQAQAEDASHRYDSASEKLVALQERFQMVSEQFEAEKETHAQTSLHMISFKDQVTLLERQVAELRSKETHQRDLLGPLQAQADKLREETSRLETELREKSAALEEVKSQRTAMEFQSQQKEMVFEQGKLDHQIGTAAVLRQKDAEYSQLQRTTDEELHRLRGEVEKCIREIRALESGKRKESRKNERLEWEMKQKDKDFNDLTAKEAALRSRLAEATEDFRENILAATVNAPTTARAGGSGTTEPGDDVEDNGRSPIDELVRTYKEAQERAAAESSAVGAECRSLKDQNRRMYRKICDLRDYLDEQAITGGVDVSLLNDQDIFGSQNTVAEDIEHKQELARLQEKILQAEARGQDHQETALQLAERSRATEQKLAEASQKITEMEAELADSQSTSMLQKIEGMQHDLVEQVALLKDHAPPANANELQKELVDLRKQKRKYGTEALRNAVKISQLEEVKKDNERLRSEIEVLKKKSTSAARGGGAARPASGSVVVGEGEVIVHAVFLTKLERERADLLVKKEKLESELKGYKDYMRSEAAKWRSRQSLG
jgi:hypothetical protein